MRHARASESPFWPSPGQFIKWCKDSKMVLGVSIEDVMGEFHRYAKEKSLQPGGPEQFPWRHPVMYWIVCDTRRAMYQRQLSEIEVEKHARKLLDEWASKVAAGHQIPDPILSIQSKPEPISTPPDPGGNTYHPPGRSFGCMPNAADTRRYNPGTVADGGIPAREGSRTHQVIPARERIFLRLNIYQKGNKICARLLILIRLWL
ncbi:Origin specific replication binding factor [Klebsiella pneumoniae]|uniref:Origin specific replication binding factor n=1 Tax=Klebsiella pneumoniae TaxID=573 RepID=A0A377XE49_KLEPN|nr:Origin specific replication binding factor [Klebsiella pneumoniae]